MSQTQHEALSFIQERYPNSLLLTKAQTAKVLNISPAGLDRLRKDGRISAQMVGGKVLYRVHEIARYLG